MTIHTVQQPIINSPYKEPEAHWQIHTHAPAEKLPGRRPPTYTYLPPGRAAAKAERSDSRESQVVDIPLVSLLRQRLAEWRPLALRGEAGVSRITMELLNYWHRDGRRHPLFFAQLEAAETIIFLTEARADFLQGIDIPQDTGAGGDAFQRRCCRMATGAGKTTVMGMLAAWSILNKVFNKQDKRFSEAVLVVCPNVTIRDRLAELNPQLGDVSIYRTRDLVPQNMMPHLQQGKLFTVNWHVFNPRDSQAGSKVLKTGKHVPVQEKIIIGETNTTARGKRYMTEATLRKKHTLGLLQILPDSEERDKNGNLKSVHIKADKYVESDAALMRRVLAKELGNRSNILVFNDEAHHAYRPQETPLQESFLPEQESLIDDEDMEREYCREATIWIKGLDMVQKSRGINFCVDFSATPYFLAKAGDQTNHIFPWTVSSFDLQDAIEAGLVKIPQLPVRDPSGKETPEYLNIWESILPRLTAAERGGRKSAAKPEAILKHAHTPIIMLATEWQKQFQLARENNSDPRPPVFIIVCKTKKLADIIYQWLAEGESPNTLIPSANIPELRNSPEQQNTILVHSDMQAKTDSGDAKNDHERWMRHTLDTIGKTDWPRDTQDRPQYPQEFETLAEKMQRPKHPPGRDVRCIVSVSMLTEGWDCNTVTHIIGLRPFMSQLLCEQVVGRGLRRISYETDVNNMMSEEIATVLGVPLSTFLPVKSNTQPQKHDTPRERIFALPGKQEFAIRFPRVEGYTQSVRRRIVCDMETIPTLQITPDKISPQVEMKAALLDNKGRPSLHGPGKATQIDLENFRNAMRLQERIWEMTTALTKYYFNETECQLPANAAFLQLYRIVAAYIHEKVSVVSPSDRKDAFMSPYYGYIIENLLSNIRPDTCAGEAPELPRYERMRGAGSTADVDFHTRRRVYAVTKSHINAVVADTRRFEQSAAWHLEQSLHVISFAKNENMGFAIPYQHDGETHEYLPDFIIRLQGAEENYLILETKGYDERKETKKAAAQRWVSAINADGKHGRWQYAMVADRSEIVRAIDTAAAVAASASAC